MYLRCTDGPTNVKFGYLFSYLHVGQNMDCYIREVSGFYHSLNIYCVRTELVQNGLESCHFCPLYYAAYPSLSQDEFTV